MLKSLNNLNLFGLNCSDLGFLGLSVTNILKVTKWFLCEGSKGSTQVWFLSSRWTPLLMVDTVFDTPRVLHRGLPSTVETHDHGHGNSFSSLCRLTFFYPCEKQPPIFKFPMFTLKQRAYITNHHFRLLNHIEVGLLYATWVIY